MSVPARKHAPNLSDVKTTPSDLRVIRQIDSVSSTTHESGVANEIVTVTPGMATEWLDRGGENRTIHWADVNRYAAAMKAGEWRLTGESIKLNTKGHVKDGQHRLWACIEADTPFVTMVTINVPEDAFDVMDSGRSRSNADIVGLHHYENAHHLAPFARLSIIWETSGVPLPTGRYNVSKPEILRWIEENPASSEWVTFGRGITRAGLPGGAGTWSAVLYRLYQTDEQDARAFVEKLISGAGLEDGDPILALRNRVLGAATRGNRLVLHELCAITIKSWNAWRKGRKIKLLSWQRGGANREDFPRPE